MRNGKIIGRENFVFKDVLNEEENEIIVAFLKQFYSSNDRFIPKEIVIKTCYDECDLLEEWLTNKTNYKVNIIMPQKGEKKQLLEMVEKNVEIELVRQDGDNAIVLGQLSTMIGYKGKIERIEAYDISNLGNEFMVGSMIVFGKGFEKGEYRKYKIKTVKTQSDVDCMKEVITRRLNNDEQSLPNLILIDGGKNQINAVKDIINRVNPDIVVCGMYKDNKHRTKGLMLGNEQKIELKDTPQVFKLITKIQDEVHRFAIEYHKKLRSKELSKSALDNINGIGPKRKLELLKHFGSIEKIKQASIDELKQVSTITEELAKKIKDELKFN